MNRVRYVNFQYGAGMIIRDKTYNMGGQHTLLNLINGGGKTSMIHMLAQAVIPNTSYEKRPISLYFSGPPRTTYVMIEWLLDNNSGYLLTGFCAKGGHDDVEKWLPFQHYYLTQNNLSLDSIPVIVEGLVTPFSDFKSRLTQERLKNGVPIYTYDQKKSFGEDLRKYGIYSDEWEEHLRMNTAETAGLNQYFEKIKTSGDLMKKEIVPCISNKIQKINPLSDHQESLVRHYALLHRLPKIEQELQDLRQISPLLEKWLDKCIEYDDAKKALSMAQIDLASFRLGVDLELGKVIEQMADTEKEIAEIGQRLRDMEHKLQSFQLYERNKEVAKFDQLLAQLSEDIDNASAEVAELSKKIEQAAASEALEILIESEGLVTELKTQQEAQSKDNKEKFDELTGTGGILAARATHLLNTSQSSVERMASEGKEMDRTIAGIKDTITKIVEDIGIFFKDEGRLEAQITQFQEGVAAEASEHFSPMELLSLEGNPGAFLAEQTKRKNGLERDQKKSLELTQTTQTTKDELVRQIKSSEQAVQDLTIAANKLIASCSAHETAEAALLTRVSAFSTQASGVYDGTLGAELSNHRQKAVQRETILQEERQQLIPELERIDADFYVASGDIVDLTEQLHRLGIVEAITGSEYLQSTVDPESLLRRYPALPYSVVVNNDSVVKLSKRNQALDIVIPGLLISRESLLDEGSPADEVNFVIALGSNVFAARPDDFKYYLSKADYDEMKQRCIKRKEILDADLVTCKNDQNHYLTLENAVSEFLRAHPLDAHESNKNRVLEMKGEIAESKRNIVITEKELADHEQKLEELARANTILAQQIQEVELSIRLATRYHDGAKKRDAAILELAAVSGNIEKQRTELSTAQAALAKKEQTRESLQEALHIEEAKQAEPQRILKLVAQYRRDVVCDETATIDFDLLLAKWKGLKIAYEASNSDHAILALKLLEAESSRRKNEATFSKFKIPREVAKENGLQPQFLQEQWKDERKDILERIQKRREDKSRTEGKRESPKATADQLVKSIREIYNRPPVTYFVPADSVEAFEREIQRITSAQNNAQNAVGQLIGIKKSLAEASSILAKIDLPRVDKPREIILSTITKDTDELKEKRTKAQDELRTCTSAVSSAAGAIARYTQLSSSASVADLIRLFGGTEEDIFDLEWAERTAKEFGQIISDEQRSLELQRAEIQSERQEIVENLAKWVCIFLDEIPLLVGCSRAIVQGQSRLLLEIKLGISSQSSGNMTIISERLSNYLTTIVSKLDKAYGENGDDVNLSKDIVNYLSPYAILEEAIHVEEAQIRVWKEEVVSVKSRMVKWEEGQSGAQGLLASFIVYVARMTYISKGGDGKIPHSRTIIADNPFGTMNADYIMTVLFDLFNRNRIQFIAFSGHEDAGIYRQFDRVSVLSPTLSNNGRYVVLDVKELKRGTGEIVLQEAKITGVKSLHYNLFGDDPYSNIAATKTGR